MITTTTTSGTIKTFKDLDCWKEGHKFVLSIYAITKIFPSDERYGLVSQLRRAAVSITSNIAEGFSRRHEAEKIQFYTTAFSSLTEIQNQLLIARDIDYLDAKAFESMDFQSIRVAKLIRGLLRSVRKAPV